MINVSACFQKDMDELIKLEIQWVFLLELFQYVFMIRLH